MGTFASYYGEMNIPEEKRPEFAERMLKLFTQGGMMNLDSVKVMDVEVELLCLPKIDEKGNIIATYNYFEDDWWEGAGYNTETGRIWSNKIGWRHFNRVTQAAYVLAEFYSDTFMLAEVDGEVVYAGEIIAWLNHLFDETYTNVRSRDLWEIYKLLPDYAKDQDLLQIVRPEEDGSRSTFSYLNYFCVSQMERFEEIVAGREEIRSSEDMFNPIDWIQKLRGALKEIKETTVDLDAELAFLKQRLLLELPKHVDFPEGTPYRVFSLATVLLSYELVLFFIADTFEMDFWQLLEEMEPLIMTKEDTTPLLEWDPDPFPVIPPEDTAEFLCCSDDDRAFFWTKDGDVAFSDEMQEWMAGLKEELEEILATEGNLIDPADFFVTFLKTLEQTNKTYRRVYAFSSMFQEFIGKAGQREYQAAVVLLQRLVKRYEDEAETLRNAHWSHELDLPGRRNMKRYLAILANAELRQRVFGF